MKPQTSNTAAESSETHGIRMLLENDSPVILRSLTTFFTQDHRFPVVGTTADGRQTILTVTFPAPQLVLLYMHLPYPNGTEVTRCLKQFNIPPVIFMITSDDRADLRRLSAVPGVDAFLIKSGTLICQLKSKLQKRFGPRHPPRPGSVAVSPCTSSSLTTPSSGSAR